MNEEFATRIKRLVIRAMFSHARLSSQLVLKGGNLLDLVFEISARSSIDVDFSISDEFESVELLRAIAAAALHTVFAQEGFEVFDVTVDERPTVLTENMRPFWGGYQLFFKIIELDRFQILKSDLDALRRHATVVGTGQERKFRIDISKHEYCDETEETEFEGCRIVHYSPEAAAFEKLRSICQQMPEYLEIVGGSPAGRARDFFDVCQLADAYQINFAAPENRDLVARIFKQKRVPLKLIARIGDDDVRDLHERDFVAVRGTIKGTAPLRDFDFYVDHLMRLCAALEPLWNE